LTIPGLLGFPIGTLISVYILYLLFSQKGADVCSPQYQAVIAATPHIRYRTSKIVIGLLVLVAVLVAIGVAAAILTRIR